MSTIRQLMGLENVVAWKPVKEALAIKSEIDSEELIGIEVEVEALSQIKKPNPIWTMKGDGSLRNNGAEFISHPFAAKYAPWALENLLKDSLDTNCSFSMRTSIHVHLNAQDMESDQAINLVLLYCLFEPVFYKMAGRGRSKNIYCIPVIDTWQIRGFLESKLSRWEKYSGLNLKTLSNYGTMEFRHMPGTFDINKISKWIDVITRFKQYVLKNSTKNIREMIRGIHAGVGMQRLLEDIIGPDLVSAMTCGKFPDLTVAVLRTKHAFVSMSNIKSAGWEPTTSSPFLDDVKEKGTM